MRKLITILLLLINLASFGQYEKLFNGKNINPYNFILKDKFIWEDVEVYRDSLIYSEIETDSIRFRYFDGSWTEWYHPLRELTSETSDSVMFLLPDATFGFGLLDTTAIVTANWETYISNHSGDGGATQLSGLSDVGTVGYTNRHVLVADGVNYDSRALVEADISDFGTYDNYQNWSLRVDGVLRTSFSSNETFELIGGTGIDLDYTTQTLTINSTASGGSPGGTSGQIQYNNAGSFGGFGDWNGSTLDIPGGLEVNSLLSILTATLYLSDGYINLGNATAEPSSMTSGQGAVFVGSPSDVLMFTNNTDKYTVDLTSSSDFFKKKDFKLIDSPLDKILKLQSYQFNWKEDWPETAPNDPVKIELQNDKKEREETGMVAQEVEKIIPEAVGTFEESGYKNIDYKKLVPYLVEAIKEQQKQIDKLKREIEKLK